MVLRTLVVGALFVVGACAQSEPLSPVARDAVLFERAPADGNGNKIVEVLDFDWPDVTTCPSGATLTLHIVGWLQDRPTKGVVSFYFEFTYANAAGETYVWHQVGLGHFDLDESGNLIAAFNGRTLDNIGRMVVNLATGELVSAAGRASVGDSVVCEALT
jgi:hypothetical protein